MVAIDGSNLILGRMSTIVAKKLLNGECVLVVNADKIIIGGNKQTIVKKFKARIDLQPKGNPMKGPKFSRMPDKIVKTAVRGMLPYKRERGKKAFKNLRIYCGIPKEFEGKKFEKIAVAENNLGRDFISVADLSAALGAKV